MTENSLTALLRTTHFLTRVADVGQSLGRGFAYWLGLGLVAIVLDAVLDLPSWTRVLVGVAWLGSLIFLSGRFFSRQWRTEFNLNQVARQVEVAIGISDNALVNAVGLAGNQTGAVSRQLVQVVVERGNDFGIRTAASDATRFAPTLRWLAIGFGMACITLLIHFMVPQLYSRVLPRYLQPFANHPPFTSLTFSWDVEPLPAIQGDDIFLQVQIDGYWLPEKAELLVQAEGNNPPTVIPLTAVSENQYELTLTSVQESMTVAIDTPLGQSQWQTLVVLQIPRILSTTAQYQFPEYTQWPTERKSLNVPMIRAIRGTTVEIQVEASLPLQQGTLTLDSPHGQTPITMLPAVDQPTMVTGQFVLDQQTGFQISLQAVNGSSDRDNLRGKIEVLIDQPPRIEVVEPDRFVMAVEDWKIPIELHSGDDVQLNQVELLHWLNEDPSIRRAYDLEKKVSDEKLPTITKSRNAVRITDQIDLAQLGAKAGDSVKFFAVAEDNYPADNDDSPAHRVTTPTFTIQVITLEEFQELKRELIQMDDIREEMQEIQDRMQELQERRQELLEQLDALTQSAEQLEAGDDANAEQNKAQRELLQKQLAEYEKEVSELIDDLWEKAETPPAYDFENTLHEQWRELLEQLDDQRIAAKNVREALEQSQPNQDDADLQAAVEQFRQQEQPFDEATQQQQQETMEAIARLQAAEQIMEMMQQLSEVIEDQQQIAQQMEQFRDVGQDSPPDETQQGAMNRLAKQQEMLQQELEELLEQMREAAVAQQEELPEVAEQLQELADKIEESQATEDQREAAESSREGQGEQAADAAQAAAEKLRGCQSDCEGLQPGMGQPGMGPARPIPPGQMERSLQQMREAIKGRAGQRGRPGQMPGQRPGQGQGQPGEAEGQASGQPGGASDQRPVSRSSLMGPGDPSSRKSARRRGNRSNSQDGSGRNASGEAQALSLEQLTPEAREAARRGVSGLRGVPSHYREHGRAYLQRLNEVDQQ